MIRWKIGPLPIRFEIAGIICLACIIYGLIRSNLSIIILAMTKNPYNSSIELPDYGIRYEWSTYQQSLVIGSYFWGNTISCAIAGAISGRYGSRYILGFTFAMAATLSAVSPVGAQFLWLAILIRFLTGIMMGGLYPSLQALVSNWAPPEERGKFLSLLTFSGVGAVIDWSMSGYIIAHYGWIYAFYVVGIIFGLFTIIWFLSVYDSPSKHPRITEKEKEFILSKLSSTTTSKKPWPPLKSIFLSLPFWALVCFHFGDMCGYYFLLTSAPRYLSEVHEFNITTTGLLASIPYLARIPFAVLFAHIGDILLKKKLMSTNAIRKTFSMCSHFIPGLFLIGITFIGDRPYACLALITIGLCFNSAVVITSMHNAHDLAPNYASSIYGLISLVGSAAGYLTPMLVAYFTKDRSTEEEWRKVFFVGAGMYIGSTIIFLLIGSGHVQKWNTIVDDATPIESLKYVEKIDTKVQDTHKVLTETKS